MSSKKLATPGLKIKQGRSQSVPLQCFTACGAPNDTTTVTVVFLSFSQASADQWCAKHSKDKGFPLSKPAKIPGNVIAPDSKGKDGDFFEIEVDHSG